MKRNVLIIGAGGVAHVVAHKCAQNNSALGEIHIASRTLEKCQSIVESVLAKRSLQRPGVIQAHALNALDVPATVALIRALKAGIVINVGSSFLNMSVLAACIETGAAYIDTAIHEDPAKICETPPWYGNYEWQRREACAKAGVTAILGIGFDPGVVNAYARVAQDSFFERIDSIDIIDTNAGSHGRYFATNFDPEINFREFTGTVWSWQNRQWTANKMFEQRAEWDLPAVGRQTTYLTGHDELHSLSKFLDVPDIRFWMGVHRAQQAGSAVRAAGAPAERRASRAAACGQGTAARPGFAGGGLSGSDLHRQQGGRAEKRPAARSLHLQRLRPCRVLS
jgi:saccharopine dehydrogenase-like NADP-dependent oxidoreductase